MPMTPAPVAPLSTRDLAGIAGLVYSETGPYEVLRDLCDSIGPRMSGQPGGDAAEAFVAARLREAGLEPRFQAVEFRGWQRDHATATCLSPHLKGLSVASLAKTPEWSVVEADLCDLGHGVPADFEAAGAAVRGRIAIVDSAEPEGHRSVHRTEKMH
jgi:hypothetical protein